MNLNNRIALVTGGATRVGRALCLNWQPPVALWLCTTIGRAGSEALVNTLQRRGGRAVPAGGFNQTGGMSATHCRQACAGPSGYPYYNAAVFHRRDLRHTSAADLRAVFDLNLIAPTLLMRYFAAQTDVGRIVNILDQSIVSNRFDTFAYSLSKKSLAAATAAAALELAPKCTVNAVAPARSPRRRAAGSGRLHPLNASGAVGCYRSTYFVDSDAVTGQVI